MKADAARWRADEADKRMEADTEQLLAELEVI